MSCVAKKDEIQRKNASIDVDAFLTIREFDELIKIFGINFLDLVNDIFDSILDESTSASTIFGVTGGVMEAFLQFIHESLTGSPLKSLEYIKLRGFDMIRKGYFVIEGVKIKCAICNGIASVRAFIES
jgi:iron only hydrogenase large subunit-like protein